MSSISSEQGGYAREVYSVQGLHVTLDLNKGWQCTCEPFMAGGECAHVEQARAFREMRGTKREEETIEIELSAEELLKLSTAAQDVTPIQKPRNHIPSNTPEPTWRHSHWAVVLTAATSIAAMAVAVTFFTSSSTEPGPVVENSPPPPRPAPAPSVSFVNPFDPTEVFTLPAGMSDDEAREAVAEFLLQRAHARLDATADAEHEPAGPMRLADSR